MKILPIVFLLMTGCAHDWSRSDSIREASYLALHAVDWSQTRHNAKENGQGGVMVVTTSNGIIHGFEAKHVEGNPFLGSDPSVKEVDIYMATAALLHVGISSALPAKSKKWWIPDRSTWQYITIGIETSVVVNNARNANVGIRIPFR